MIGVVAKPPPRNADVAEPELLADTSSWRARPLTPPRPAGARPRGSARKRRRRTCARFDHLPSVRLQGDEIVIGQWRYWLRG
jgi:hypothetical protein